MKTTKQRLLNLVITMSVAINLVLLGGLGYLASMEHHVEQAYTAMNQPVVIYSPKAVESSAVAPSAKPAATP